MRKSSTKPKRSDERGSPYLTPWEQKKNAPINEHRNASQMRNLILFFMVYVSSRLMKEEQDRIFYILGFFNFFHFQILVLGFSI